MLEVWQRAWACSLGVTTLPRRPLHWSRGSPVPKVPRGRAWEGRQAGRDSPKSLQAALKPRGSAVEAAAELRGRECASQGQRVWAAGQGAAAAACAEASPSGQAGGLGLGTRASSASEGGSSRSVPEQHVARRQVPMGDAQAVQEGERRRHLAHRQQDGAQRGPAASAVLEQAAVARVAQRPQPAQRLRMWGAWPAGMHACSELGAVLSRLRVSTCMASLAAAHSSAAPE